jgi:hypothetical protein
MSRFRTLGGTCLGDVRRTKQHSLVATITIYFGREQGEALSEVEIRA